MRKWILLIVATTLLLTLVASCACTADGQIASENSDVTSDMKHAVADFKRQNKGPVTVGTRDGTYVFGALGTVGESTFILVEHKTGYSKEIRYADVTSIILGRSKLTAAQKSGRVIENILLLPIRILKCFLLSCGS